MYRVASASSHYSSLTALRGFVGDPEPGEEFAPVALHLPDPDASENALVWAITAYHAFLIHTESTLRLGAALEAHALVGPWLRNHPYIRPPEGAA